MGRDQVLCYMGNKEKTDLPKQRKTRNQFHLNLLCRTGKEARKLGTGCPPEGERHSPDRAPRTIRP